MPSMAITNRFCFTDFFYNPASIRQEGQSMKNPLDSLWGTIITGVILTAILYYLVKNVLN